MQQLANMAWIWHLTPSSTDPISATASATRSGQSSTADRPMRRALALRRKWLANSRDTKQATPAIWDTECIAEATREARCTLRVRRATRLPPQMVATTKTPFGTHLRTFYHATATNGCDQSHWKRAVITTMALINGGRYTRRHYLALRMLNKHVSALIMADLSSLKYT